jgi:hypothetical protein
MGGALPYWAYAGYGWYVPPMSLRPCEPAAEEAPSPSLTFSEVLSVLERRTAAVADRPSSAARSGAARGISLDYGGRVWLSAGPAVRFNDAAFVRVGERAGSPVFREIGKDESVIYVPTTPGMVAPFQAQTK